MQILGPIDAYRPAFEQIPSETAQLNLVVNLTDRAASCCGAHTGMIKVSGFYSGGPSGG